MKDYYYILNVSRDATKKEIKSAFRKMSLKFHPDQNDGEEFFEKHFREILEAYEILYDDAKKLEYDVIYAKWLENKNNFDNAEFKDFSEKYKREAEYVKEKLNKIRKEWEKQKEGIKESIFNEEKIKNREIKAKNLNKKILNTFLLVMAVLIIIYIFYYGSYSKGVDQFSTSHNNSLKNNYATEDASYNKHLELANYYYNNENYDYAIMEYTAAIQIKPKSAEAFLGLGKSQDRSQYVIPLDNNYDDGWWEKRNMLGKKAVINFKKAIQLKQDYPEPYYYLGNILHTEALTIKAFSEIDKVGYQKAINEALYYSKSAVLYSPRWAEAHLLLGEIYLDLGNNKLAREEHEALLKIDKSYADVLLRRFN